MQTVCSGVDFMLKTSPQLVRPLISRSNHSRLIDATNCDGWSDRDHTTLYESKKPKPFSRHESTFR